MIRGKHLYIMRGTAVPWASHVKKDAVIKNTTVFITIQNIFIQKTRVSVISN